MSDTKRILIVEDDRDIAHLLKMILTKQKFEVAIAYNEEDFRKQAFAFLPNLILLDLMLGNKNGVQIYEKLLEEGFSPTPVLVLSAGLKGISAVLGAKGEQYQAMSKPFETKELLANLNAKLTQSN